MCTHTQTNWCFDNNHCEDFYHSQRITQSTDQGGERDAFILCKYFTKLEPNEEGGLS